MSKTLDCGCVIYSAGRFTFCKLHAQAPALLEALKAIEGIIGDAVDQRIRSGRLPPIANLLSSIEDEARAAIQSAKGDA